MKKKQFIRIPAISCRGCVNNGAWICEGCDPNECIFREPLPDRPVDVTPKQYIETDMPEAV